MKGHPNMQQQPATTTNITTKNNDPMYSSQKCNVGAGSSEGLTVANAVQTFLLVTECALNLHTCMYMRICVRVCVRHR